MSFAAIDLDLQAVKTALGHVRDLALEESFTAVSKAQALRIANVMRRSELDTASLVACMEKVRDVGFAEVDKTMLLNELTTLLSNPNLDATPTIVKKAANSTQKGALRPRLDFGDLGEDECFQKLRRDVCALGRSRLA